MVGIRTTNDPGKACAALCRERRPSELSAGYMIGWCTRFRRHKGPHNWDPALYEEIHARH